MVHPDAHLILWGGIEQSDALVENNGIFEVFNGYLLSGGTVTSESSATATATFTADFVDQSGGAFTNKGELVVTGDYELSAGTLTNAAGQFAAASFTADTFEQTDGDVHNAGGLFTVIGIYSIEDGSLLSENAEDLATFTANAVVQTGGEVTNKAIFNITEEYELIDGDLISTMGSGGAATLTADAFTQSGGVLTNTAARLNALTFTLSGGEANFTATSSGKSLDADDATQSGGLLTVYDGLLDIANAFAQTAGIIELRTSSVVVGSGWTISSGATLYTSLSGVTGDFTNSGTIEINLMDGTSFTSDRLNVSHNFTQTSGGRINLDAVSLASEKLNVGNLATLAGTLQVRVPPGTTYPPMVSLQLVTYGSRSGTFGTLIPPPGNWMATYETGFLKITKMM
jgi:hypothetical protein